MILIDMNQISVGIILQEFKGNISYDEGLIRHMIINSIRSIRNKFHKEYGEIILCYDNKNSWRKSIFPYYKIKRKEKRENSNINWNNLFEIMSKIKQEITENLPYKVISIEGCESDDIIATAAIKYRTSEKVLIVSSDGDFVQLQQLSNIYQYSPIHKNFIKEINPNYYLFEHIMRGDTSDSIPNVLSDSDTFTISGKRQKRLSEKYIKECYAGKHPEYQTERFKQNREIIDFDYIPLNIKEKISKELEKEFVPDRKMMLDYFINNKMTNMIEHLTEF